MRKKERPRRASAIWRAHKYKLHIYRHTKKNSRTTVQRPANRDVGFAFTCVFIQRTPPSSPGSKYIRAKSPHPYLRSPHTFTCGWVGERRGLLLGCRASVILRSARRQKRWRAAGCAILRARSKMAVLCANIVRVISGGVFSLSRRGALARSLTQGGRALRWGRK